jgi:hypothetical protein
VKLSDAILKGAQQRPQCTGDPFMTTPDGGLLASCALGAAWEGRFGAPDPDALEEGGRDYVYSELGDAFPELEACRYCGNPDALDEPYCERDFEARCEALWSHIANLNDAEGWSRESIAAWLAERGL